MDKEFYTYKDILFGSRAEYLKIQSKLSKLKKLIYISDKNIKDFNFELVGGYINSHHGNIVTDKKSDPELICRFVQELKTLKGILTYLKLQINCYDYRDEVGRVVNSKNGYIIKCVGESPKIDYEKVNEFDSLVKEILNSDFVKKINFIINFEKNSTEKTNLEQLLIFPNRIKFAEINLNYYVNMSYEASNDIMTFNSSRNLSEEIFLESLNHQVPATLLSDYHKELIDSSPVRQREIKIIGELDEPKLNFKIEEKEDKIVLQKVRCPKINKYNHIVR